MRLHARNADVTKRAKTTNDYPCNFLQLSQLSDAAWLYMSDNDREVGALESVTIRPCHARTQDGDTAAMLILLLRNLRLPRRFAKVPI